MELFALTVALPDAVSMPWFEIDSKKLNAKSMLMPMPQKIIDLDSEIKGNIPQFYSRSTGYIFWFSDVNWRKLP